MPGAGRCERIPPFARREKGGRVSCSWEVEQVKWEKHGNVEERLEQVVFSVVWVLGLVPFPVDVFFAFLFVPSVWGVMS